MNLTIENILLVGSLLLFVSIIVGKTSYKFGVPTLLLFLVIGMLAGTDGIGGINFDNPQIAQFIGIVSLNFILFSGTLREFSEDYIVHSPNNIYKFKCKLCEKEFTTRQKIENHIESIHFPGFFVYPCVPCNTSVNTRQKYYHHINKFHSRKEF